MRGPDDVKYGERLIGETYDPVYGKVGELAQAFGYAILPELDDARLAEYDFILRHVAAGTLPGELTELFKDRYGRGGCNSHYIRNLIHRAQREIRIRFIECSRKEFKLAAVARLDFIASDPRVQAETRLKAQRELNALLGLYPKKGSKPADENSEQKAMLDALLNRVRLPQESVNGCH